MNNSPNSLVDYQKNKEQNNYQPSVNIQPDNDEQKILQELNQSLNLGLNNPNLKQVINKIQELIHKPPSSFSNSGLYSSPATDKAIDKQLQAAQQTILQLEKELSQKDTPFGGDLATIKNLEIKKLEQLLPNQLEEEFIYQIKQSQNYEQLVAVRNNYLAKQLTQAQKSETQEIIKPMELSSIGAEPSQIKYER